MKWFKLLLLVPGITLVLSACIDDLTLPPAADAPPPIADVNFQLAESSAPVRHLVMFRGSAPEQFAQQVDELGGSVVLNHPVGIAVVAGLDEATAARLERRTNARFVIQEPEFHLLEPTATRGPIDADLTSIQDPTQAIRYPTQWNLHQVNAESAWAAGRLGSPDVTVAILDTGIDYMLPDFQGRVDLARSASFVPQDDGFVAAFFPGRHVSTDLHYHGTNVATQVASNAWAFAGVTSQTTLMSVKVCGVLGGCPGVTEGILHAIDNGADVINMSLGGWFRKSAFPGAVSFYNTLMNYAQQRGVTIVVAAGNDGIDLDRTNNVPIRDGSGQIVDRIHIPSFFSTYCDATHVICVAATRRNDVPASYTNFGRSAIDVSAPGGDGATGDWVDSLCPQTSLLFNCGGGLFVLGLSGTSMAAPHVAGLAALAVEDVGRSPAQVRAYIRNSAHAVGDTPGNSPYHGRGRIDVGNAVGATN